MLQRLLGAGLLVVLVTACGTTGSAGEGGGETPLVQPSATESGRGTDPSPPPESREPGPGPSDSAGPAPGTRIRVADSEFGPMLFDTAGQAIYLFDREVGPRAQCYGACAADWPPVLTDGGPRAVRGARQGLLGTTERRDGSLQVTYGGHPLYYYAHEDPGQVLCHDVVEYGGTWLVVQPDGDAAP